MVNADSDEGSVNIIYLPLRRRDVMDIVGNIKRYNPQAFYTLEDARLVSGNVTPLPVVRAEGYRKHRLWPGTKKK
jgi:hypothetical protein